MRDHSSTDKLLILGIILHLTCLSFDLSIYCKYMLNTVFRYEVVGK